MGDEERDSDSDDEDEEELDSDGANFLGGDSTRLPIVVENTPAAGSSADDLNKSFGGMSISPVRRMDVLKSCLEMAA